MVLGRDDGKIVIFSITNNGPKRVHEITAHEKAITGLSFANNSLNFLTGSKDGRVNLWTIKNERWRPTAMKLYGFT